MKIHSLLFLLIASFVIFNEEGTFVIADEKIKKEIVEYNSELPAAEVKTDAIVLSKQMEGDFVLTGFGGRYATALPPRAAGAIFALFVDGKEVSRLAMPWLPFPAKDFTATAPGRNPFDVSRELRLRLEPALKLHKGQQVQIKVVSAPVDCPALGGVIQFAGQFDVAQLRAPWRETRQAGPVCSIPWGAPEEICTGTEKAGDPRCSPQNNSGVVADDDGTLWQFTAFYSVDEQFGGGRAGSYSRVIGFHRGTTGKWNDAGIVADPVPWGKTYAGDPFAFRDHNGTPCLAISVADGTNGFIDWKKISLVILRSQSRSFEGPWSQPFYLFKDLPGNSHDDRIIGSRLFPRKDGSWVVTWNHGERDIAWRALVLPDLNHEVPHATIMAAPILARNQEEGGGGFATDDSFYLSSWQIPGINDPTGIQRLYRMDINKPLDLASWRIVPGSVGWTDPSDERQNGGPTADAWSLSLPKPNTLWATAVLWSASERRNRILAWQCQWPIPVGPWRIGAPDRSWSSNGTNERIFPCLEWALGPKVSVEIDIEITRPGVGLAIGLAPAESPQGVGGIGYSLGGGWQSLDIAPTAPPIIGRRKILLERNGDLLRVNINGKKLPELTLTATQKTALTNDTRFVLALSRGTACTIHQLIINDMEH